MRKIWLIGLMLAVAGCVTLPIAPTTEPRIGLETQLAIASDMLEEFMLDTFTAERAKYIYEVSVNDRSLEPHLYPLLTSYGVAYRERGVTDQKGWTMVPATMRFVLSGRKNSSEVYAVLEVGTPDDVTTYSRVYTERGPATKTVIVYKPLDSRWKTKGAN